MSTGKEVPEEIGNQKEPDIQLDIGLFYRSYSVAGITRCNNGQTQRESGRC